ncbi:unnamed protein product [Adineta steineri]|uniref:Uncharacterized protein n=1 Tax=Adineta steineri TaxID=433720 RepID=A0A815TX26_9BILA|nr:unnamed protein product [Adineta steineri]CAF0820176.1 unnamed protein product [Adineta steineri]CAF1296571.1 unnamed protein product [Adineta steineri]CAF1506394.1 unnamed protein product [Adineta steineri]CAF1507314.1 unnamed protein product [Adineta steineri]
MGGSSSSVTMTAENARLTFPHLQQVFDIQDQEIEIENTRKKIFNYIVSGIDHAPANDIMKNLVKYAISYITAAVEDSQDPIDRKIERHIGRYLYTQLSAEFDEIKRKLKLIQHCMAINGWKDAYADISYCISRCGVLLSLFLNNINHALAMGTLFKELCLVYIALGLVLAEYNAVHIPHIIDRFNEIEEAVKKFKEAAVSQRLKMILLKWWCFTDPLRPDMMGIQIMDRLGEDLEGGSSDSGYFDLVGEINSIKYEELTNYKRQLESIYSHYFDKIKFQALDQARNRIATIEVRRATQ